MEYVVEFEGLGKVDNQWRKHFACIRGVDLNSAMHSSITDKFQYYFSQIRNAKVLEWEDVDEKILETPLLLEEEFENSTN